MASSFNSYSAGLLDLLAPHVREALLQVGTRMLLVDGQLLQSRGTRSPDLTVILRGGVRMMTISLDGREFLTAILGPGQQFNEVTLFAGAARTHDAAAVGDTELLILTSAEYEAFAKQYPEIVHALLVSNVQRVHQLVEAFNDLRALPKQVMLARVLLKNARHVQAGQTANSVDLDLTQHDLANFLGVSRAYLNKVLGQLTALKLIEVSYRRIRILGLTELEEWARDQLSYDPVEGAARLEPGTE